MAIDQALLDSARNSQPVLRLYGFSPPCLSIGLNQKLKASLIKKIRDRGFDIVRRPSGGRAVLHYFDLTYSFVAAEKNTGKNGVLESSVSAAYKQICAGLSQAFAGLGLQAELGSRTASYRNFTDCFQAVTNADLQVSGLKLAGSAQLRQRGCVLQHGSIPLRLDQNLAAELLADTDEGADDGSDAFRQEIFTAKGSAKQALKRHANLFELLNRELSIEQLESALKSGFETAFQCKFEDGCLSQSELEHAAASKKIYQLNEQD